MRTNTLKLLGAILEVLFDLPHHLYMVLWVYPIELPFWWTWGHIQVAWGTWQLNRLHARWQREYITWQRQQRQDQPPKDGASSGPPPIALSS